MRYFIIITLTVLIIPLTALGQDKVIIEYKGTQGIWFAEQNANRMLQDLEEFSILKLKKIPALELKLDLKDNLIKNLNMDLEVTEKISLKWEKQYTSLEDLHLKEITRLEQKLSRKYKWYNSPTFLFITGVIAGGLLSVGIAYGLQGVK